MEELNIEEMTTLRGGFRESNRSVIIARDNEAIAVNANVFLRSANRSGGIGSITQFAEANAGNQNVSVTQSA